MGSTQPSLRRALSWPIAVLLTVGALTVVNVDAASADPVVPLTLSESALPTVQVDGVVWAQTTVGNTVYAAGQFTTARPIAGGAVTRSNVLAYDITTGELDSSFVADTNGAVRGIAASPDGSRIYIAGSFTAVDGVNRSRIAALDPSSGKPIGSFAPSLNSTATGVTVTRSAVYAIGNFSQANGVAVSKAAAFDVSSGGTLNWKPSFGDGTMRAIAASPNGSLILIGGSFTSVSGVHAGGMAALDAGSGKVLPWAASKVVDLGGDATGIYGLSGDANYAYATGWAYKDKVGENSLEGAVSMDWNTGAINWIEDCHGDSYSSSSMNGILYVASHAHYCQNVPGGFGELPPNTGHRATAFSVQAAGVLAHNTEQGPGWYQDFGGQPAPLMLGFYPDLTPGTFTGQDQAAWSVASSRNYVSYAGEFTHVNGQAQTGLTRFYEPSTSPVTPPGSGQTTPTPTPSPTPTTQSPPHQVSKPAVIALGPTAIAARWSAPSNAKADGVSGYTVKVYKGSRVVKTVRIGADTRSAVVSGLKKSTSYRVGVAARNSNGIGTQSHLDSIRTKAKGKNVSAAKHPGAVKKPTASVGKGRLRIRWVAARTAGATGVARYQVRLVHAGRTTVITVKGSARSKLVTRLSRTTTYTVSVRAQNWAGWGGWSAAKAVRTR